MFMEIRIERIDPSVPLPSFSCAHDAGLDLCAAEEVRIAPMERVQVKTGLRIAIPEGHAGLIWDKSGLSHKQGLKVLGGVIDAGYRGEWLVGIINLSDVDVVLPCHAKVAQFLVQQVAHPEVVEVSGMEHEMTERGAQGFGSSGA
jgi:dUTP pyrophosphatase